MPHGGIRRSGHSTRGAAFRADDGLRCGQSCCLQVRQEKMQHHRQSDPPGGEPSAAPRHGNCSIVDRAVIQAARSEKRRPATQRGVCCLTVTRSCGNKLRVDVHYDRADILVGSCPTGKTSSIREVAASFASRPRFRGSLTTRCGLGSASWSGKSK